MIIELNYIHIENLITSIKLSQLNPIMDDKTFANAELAILEEASPKAFDQYLDMFGEEERIEVITSMQARLDSITLALEHAEKFYEIEERNALLLEQIKKRL